MILTQDYLRRRRRSHLITAMLMKGWLENINLLTEINLNWTIECMTRLLILFSLVLPFSAAKSVQEDLKAVEVVFVQDLPKEELSEKCDVQEKQICGAKSSLDCSFDRRVCMHTDMKNPPKPIRPFMGKKLECDWEENRQGEEATSETIRAVVQYASRGIPEPSFHVKFQSTNDNDYDGREVGFGGYWVKRRSKEGLTIYEIHTDKTVAGGRCNSKFIYDVTKSLIIRENSFEIRSDFKCSHLLFFKKPYFTRLSCRPL